MQGSRWKPMTAFAHLADLLGHGITAVPFAGPVSARLDVRAEQRERRRVDGASAPARSSTAESRDTHTGSRKRASA